MNVLVIDDEAGVRRTVSMILEDEGYEVSTASNGREGLDRALDENTDIVLCDVRMPEMDGLEFLEQYQKRGGEGLDSIALLVENLDDTAAHLAEQDVSLINRTEYHGTRIGFIHPKQASGVLIELIERASEGSQSA